jgi:cytochrome c oxidase cbb3-type subunit 3
MINLNQTHKIFVSLGVLITLPSLGMAQEVESSLWSPTNLFYLAIGLTIVVALLVLVLAVSILNVLNVVLKDRAREAAEAKGVEYVEKPSFLVSWWNSFYGGMTDAVPLEREEDIMLDHNYDGIRELDNHLPPWWKYLFYVSIVFAVVYLFVYHVIDTLPLQEEEYQMELAQAEEARQARQVANVVDFDESSVEFTDDAVALANGLQVYTNNCVQCHKENGEGGIGPNLTDDYWLHGGSMQDIFKTIKYGVPEKGMIAWEALLSPTQMRDVASYIMTMYGTDPPNAKAPQGELYVREEAEATEEEGEQVEDGQPEEVDDEADTAEVKIALK